MLVGSLFFSVGFEVELLAVEPGVEVVFEVELLAVEPDVGCAEGVFFAFSQLAASSAIAIKSLRPPSTFSVSAR